MKDQVVKLRVNGDVVELCVAPNRTLLQVLREDLNLTGAKESCEDGACGACTVLIDGRPFRSCLLLAVEAEGKDILTIEGLAKGDKLHAIQQAFVEHGGVQCGMCAPGMILSAKALLDSNPNPTEHQVREALSANLCRCTGYAKIVESVLAAGRAKP